MDARDADDAATTLGLARLTDARHDAAVVRPGTPAGGGARQGPFRGRRRGQGMEFDDLRPYAAGDDVRHVDWRTSARRNALHTRLYREEKEHVATVALDLRGSMFTGGETLRGVVAGLLAARLLWRSAGAGGRVGLAALGDDGVAVSRAAAGERGALAACKLIADTFANGRERVHERRGRKRDEWGRRDRDRREPVGDEGPATTLEPLLERLLAGGRGVGTTIVVTGMDAPGSGFDAALARLAAARPLAVVLVEDPLERTAPPVGRYRFRGAGGPARIALGRAGRHRLDAHLAARRDAIERRCAAAHVPLVAARDGDAHVVRTLRDTGLLP